MASTKNIYNLCQLTARSVLKKHVMTQTSLNMKLVRHIHKSADWGFFCNGNIGNSGIIFNPNVRHISITKTFPTSHQSLKIGFEDNLASDFQYIWLRDNCQCEKCVHPDNKQKLLDTVSLDINIKPKSYHLTENGKLKMIWPDTSGEEHVSLYEPEWLHRYGKGFELDTYDSVHDTLPSKTTWNSEKIREIMPEITYEEVMNTEQGLRRWLEMMYKYGLAIMRGVPCEKGQVIKVMERVAYIKKTKWGSSFDVLCEPVQSDPGHLAYTGMYLEHHTDMNYLEKSPGLQALHCLKASSEKDGSAGGQSFFVDGFYIAKWLQKHHPSSYHILTSTLVKFKIYSHDMEYCNLQHVLCTNKSGEIQEVHYNTRTMAPMEGPVDSVQPFYEAYKLMGQKMREKDSEFAFNLVPGDLVAFNNRRVLHGRTSFDPLRLSRHLEGCYGDIDEVITQYRKFLKDSNE